MKRMLILVVIVSLLAGSLFADEAVLIDFSKLVADIHVKVTENDQETKPNQNRQTLMDYAQVAGGSFTTQQKAVMKTSLALEQWEVVLASSSRNVTNMVKSFTKESNSNQYGPVLGVRIHFPVEPHNSWAIIKPPFEIPAFEPQANVTDDGTIEPAEGDGITGPSRFESGYGVVKNVGTIKSVAVDVYGVNFPHGLTTLILESANTTTDEPRKMFMGYLKFEGWGELRWDNPAYVQEVRNRDLRLYPLYPTSTPFVKFAGFLIQRDAAQIGGDFITYFKDVKIIYDKAVLDTDRDINDEAEWSIIRDRETARKVWEMERFGQNQVLRYLDKEKQATEIDFTPAGGQQQE